MNLAHKNINDLWFYGLWRSQEGHSKRSIKSFVCKTLADIPKGTIKFESIVANRSYVDQLAKTMRTEFIKQEQNKFNKRFKISKPFNVHVSKRRSVSNGDVIIFSDIEGHHTGIVLEYEFPDSWLLFCTTSKNWNTQARPVTDDEFKLLGIPKKNCQTYFAPVYRPAQFLFSTGVTYPKDRIEKFKLEFDKVISKRF